MIAHALEGMHPRNYSFSANEPEHHAHAFTQTHRQSPVTSLLDHLFPSNTAQYPLVPVAKIIFLRLGSMFSTEVVLKVTEEESVFGDTTCAAGISVKVTSEGLLSVLGKMLAVISLIFLYRNKGGEGGRGSECDEGVLVCG